jgi:hypothetical protein
MKRVKLIILTILVFGSMAMQAQQTAPITTVGSITNAVPGTVSVPVTVSNYYDIGAISLAMLYDASHLSFVDITFDPAVYLTFNDFGGIIIISGYDMTGASLPDGTVLFTINFTFSGGSSALSWYDNGASCEYANSGLGNVLPDSPQETYYIDGVITDHPAPVTTAPLITNAVPGTVSPAITVKSFTNVGKIALKLEYDASVLTYVSSVPNAAFSGGLTISDVAGSGNIRYIIFYRSASTGVTLADNATLATLNFTYSNSTAGFCHLNWIDDGTSCQYSDPSDVPMVDRPKSLYYINGMVSGQVAPVTYMPVNVTATPGTVWMPVKVNGFTNLKSLALRYTYDSRVLTYLNSAPDEFVPNSSLTGLTVTNTVVGNTGTIDIAWSSGSPVTLANGSNIVIIPFTFSTSFANNTSLDWFDDGTSCEYKDTYLNPLFDMPTATYYTNGAISSQASPEYDIQDLYVGGAGAVSLTVNVKQFTNIGGATLTILYDPNNLSSPTVTAAAPITGSFLTNVAAPGRIIISWIAPPGGVSVADNSTFCTLGFSYAGGTDTPLTFYDIGQTCESASGIAPFSVLYDIPQSTYYKNGLVGIGSTPVLNVKAFLQGPYSSGAMTTNLNTQSVIPLTQPYSGSPWNYAGTESVTSIPAGVTDWVLVDIRTGTAASTQIQRQALFIKSNGQIVGLDGSSLPLLTGVSPGNYYVVIRHRFHLAIMSASAIPLSTGSAMYDFSTAQAQSYGGGIKSIGTGVWGMISGDANGDNTIQGSDYTIYRSLAGSSGYLRADFNMDGTVQGSDYTIYRGNAGSSSTIPN